ncbi:MAG: hypothetical protein LBR11_06795 [Deltaproteobacteria bacterium]|jgi:hypothetical protein|nr:hypothetical protein [Deltaproteobacteria bacterium]
MNTIDGRINGQTTYNPANQSRAAWREEMLGQLLSQMRERKLPDQPTESSLLSQVPLNMPKTQKGNYVNIYV